MMDDYLFKFAEIFYRHRKFLFFNAIIAYSIVLFKIYNFLVLPEFIVENADRILLTYIFWFVAGWMNMLYFVRRNEFYASGNFIIHVRDEYTEDERIDEMKKDYLRILNSGKDNFKIYSLRLGYSDGQYEILRTGKSKNMNMNLVDFVKNNVKELM